nr:hypothetical protein [Devosia aurantiaca]
MRRVANDDLANAGDFGFFDRELHGLGSSDGADAIVGIDERESRALLDDLERCARVDKLFADAFLVAAQTADALAMAGMEAQLGKDQRIGKELGVFAGEAESFKALGHEALKARLIDIGQEMATGIRPRA